MAQSLAYMKDIAAAVFVCTRVFYRDTLQKHKPNIHRWLMSTSSPAGPSIVYVLSSHFLEITSTKQGKFDGSREQLYKC